MTTDLETLLAQVPTVVDRIDKLIEHQRHNRGSYMDYGEPDPELVASRNLLTALAEHAKKLEAENERQAKALVEAITKVENDRTLWVPEWQIWLIDARTALTQKEADRG